MREIDYKIAMLKEDVRFYKILFTIAFVNYILMLILVFILIGILKTPLYQQRQRQMLLPLLH